LGGYSVTENQGGEEVSVADDAEFSVGGGGEGRERGLGLIADALFGLFGEGLEDLGGGVALPFTVRAAVVVVGVVAFRVAIKVRIVGRIDGELRGGFGNADIIYGIGVRQFINVSFGRGDVGGCGGGGGGDRSGFARKAID
jgi:hypothetical protein